VRLNERPGLAVAQVGAGDLAHFLGPLHAGEGDEALQIEAVGVPGAGVIEVGELLVCNISTAGHRLCSKTHQWIPCSLAGP
jgi:hypothetical protein